METENKIYKIGTRGSALALWQAKEVASRLEILGVQTELIIIKTAGDRFQNIPLQGQTETGFFTKEIESQLEKGLIDLAVHSLKDLPTKSNPALTLGAYLPRAEVNDLLLIHPDWHDEKELFPVRAGCVIGATSLRRQALIRLYSPDSIPTMLRGNVPGRVQKCMDGQYGAIILAQAGIQRLQLNPEPLIAYGLNSEIWLPAPGQAAIAVQTRISDSELLQLLSKLDDGPTREAVTIERKLLANFEGGCHTAFGAYAKPNGNGVLWNVLIGIDPSAILKIPPAERGGVTPWEGLKNPPPEFPEKFSTHPEWDTKWGQARFTGLDKAQAMAITPETCKGFEAVRVTKQVELCQRIQW